MSRKMLIPTFNDAGTLLEVVCGEKENIAIVEYRSEPCSLGDMSAVIQGTVDQMRLLGQALVSTADAMSSVEKS